MANLHLVTGYAGQAHVTAADDGSFNTAIFGTGQYVLDIGNKFAASVVSNNKITIADGDLLMQGRHVRMNEGTTVDLTITNGTQGKKRNDLIVARYTKDAVSGEEQVNLVVIQGTAVDSDPVDPAYTSGDIIADHDLVNDMPLYRVPLDGLNVGTPVALFSMQSVMNVSNFNNLGGVSITELWVNASPYSAFASQNIAIDFSPYDLVLVLARYHAGSSGYDNNSTVSTITQVGVTGILTIAWGDSGYMADRQFYPTSNNILFLAAERDGSNTNDFLIPYKICGIRGVLPRTTS